MTESRFHATDTKNIEYSTNTLNRAIDTGKITHDDGQLLKEFITEINATKHISPKRTFKLYYTLIGLRDYFGPYRENTIADIYTGIDNMNKARKPDGTPMFKKNTLADYTRFIKRFYLWMSENGYTKVDVRKLQKIHSPGYDTMTKTAGMLLTEAEVKRILEACKTSRDRAIISMLYEGGFRIGEMGNLRWRQVQFNEWNVAINVDDKTGKPRFVPLVMSKPYIAQWKNDYPLALEDDAYVFVTAYRNEGEQIQYNQLQYQGIAKKFRTIAVKAGIDKKITPHLLRHSRITHLIQQGYSESVIKLMMWGNITTDMFRTYAHLVNSDIENEVAIKQGITIPEQRKKSDMLEPRQCPVCYTINGPTYNFCSTCGRELTPETAIGKSNAESDIDNDPRFKAWMSKAKAEFQAMLGATGAEGAR